MEICGIVSLAPSLFGPVVALGCTGLFGVRLMELMRLMMGH